MNDLDRIKLASEIAGRILQGWASSGGFAITEAGAQGAAHFGMTVVDEVERLVDERDAAKKL
jgi:hypothetical protein